MLREAVGLLPGRPACQPAVISPSLPKTLVSFLRFVFFFGKKFTIGSKILVTVHV